MNKNIRLSGIAYESLVNGPGMRRVFFSQGCKHNCKGCFNPETHDFNGGEEKQYPGEDRILVPSPKVETYDMKPEMSAYEVTDKVCEALENDKYDVVILNFANTDMVGHTGSLQAAIKAVEAVDECVGKIVKIIEEKQGNLLITADHGNAEQMIDYKTGEPHTAHTTCLLYTSPSPRDS